MDVDVLLLVAPPLANVEEEEEEEVVEEVEAEAEVEEPACGVVEDTTFAGFAAVDFGLAPNREAFLSCRLIVLICDLNPSR